MNTLAWVAALPAILWLAVYFFETVDEDPLGVALIGVFLLGLVFLGLGVEDDLKTWFGKRKRGE